MKKFIIMSLAVFALILVSCKNDQQKCEDEGKIWIAEGEKCISQEQKDCEEKDNMTWNAEENKCEEKSDEQADCEAEEGKKWEENKCVDQLFTILFKTSGGQHFLLVSNVGRKIVQIQVTGQCVKVAASHFNDLKIAVLKDSNIEEALCDNDDKTTDISSCSPAGHYIVVYTAQTFHPPSGSSIPARYNLLKKDQAEDCTVIDTLE